MTETESLGLKTLADPRYSRRSTLGLLLMCRSQLAANGQCYTSVDDLGMAISPILGRLPATMLKGLFED